MKEKEKSVTIILPSEMRHFKIKLVYWSIFAFLILFSLLFIIPILWMLLSAFKDTKEFLQIPPSLFPEKISFEKVKYIWKYTVIGKAYLCTGIMLLGDIIFLLTSNGLAGYVMSRLKPKGIGFVITLTLWSIMLPTNLSMVPRYMAFVNLPVVHIGLTDTYWPMWLMMGASAYNAMLFKNFFDTIPRSFVEAARIDGCSELGIFAKIILPLSIPIIITVAIFGITAGWGDFFWPYLMIKNEVLQPIGVKVYLLKQNLAIDQYLLMLIFVIVPPIIAFFFLQKYVMHGLEMGGIKE